MTNIRKKTLYFVFVLVIIALTYNLLRSSSKVSINQKGHEYKSNSIGKTTFNHKAWIHFDIDNFNQLITIHGVLGNQREVKNIIKSFSDSLPDKTIAHDITIEETVRSKDFAINMTYILSSIERVQMAEVEYDNLKITIGGLVLDATSKSDVIYQLQSIFHKEKTIIDKLDIVFEEAPEIQSLKFKKPKIPKIIEQ